MKIATARQHPRPDGGNPAAEVTFWLHRDVADPSGKGRAGFAVCPKTNGFAAGLAWVHRPFFAGITALPRNDPSGARRAGGARKRQFKSGVNVTEQMGHLAAMSVPVITPSFGIRVPDVVWMSCDKWEGFDRDEPVPFVPDLYVEVLLDSDRSHDIDRRVTSYLAGGATEVIVVCHSGKVEFWGAAGWRHASVFGIAPSLDDMYFEENGGVAPAPSVRS